MDVVIDQLLAASAALADSSATQSQQLCSSNARELSLANDYTAMLRQKADSGQQLIQRQEQQINRLADYAAIKRAALLQSQRVTRQAYSWMSIVGSLYSRQGRLLAAAHQTVQQLHDTKAQQTAEIAAQDALLTAKERELVAKNNLLAAKDAQSAYKDDEIVSRDAELASKYTELAAMGAILAAKHEELANKDAILAAWNDQVVLKDAILAAKHEEMAIKDARVVMLHARTQELEKLLRCTDDWLVNNVQQLASRDAEVASKDAKLASQYAIMEYQVAKLDTLKAHRQELEKRVYVLEGWRDATDQQLAAADAEVNSLNGDIQQTRSFLHHVYLSTVRAHPVCMADMLFTVYAVHICIVLICGSA